MRIDPLFPGFIQGGTFHQTLDAFMIQTPVSSIRSDKMVSENIKPALRAVFHPDHGVPVRVLDGFSLLTKIHHFYN